RQAHSQLADQTKVVAKNTTTDCFPNSGSRLPQRRVSRLQFGPYSCSQPPVLSLVLLDPTTGLEAQLRGVFQIQFLFDPSPVGIDRRRSQSQPGADFAGR